MRLQDVIDNRNKKDNFADSHERLGGRRDEMEEEMGCDNGTIMEKGCSNCATLHEHIFNHRIYLR